MSLSLCTPCLPFQTKIFKIIRLKVWEQLYYHALRRYGKNIYHIYISFFFSLKTNVSLKIVNKDNGNMFCYKYVSFLFGSTQNDKIDVSNILACDIIAQKDFEVFSCIVCKNLTFLLFVSHKDRIRCAKVVKRKAIWWRLESTPKGLHLPSNSCSVVSQNSNLLQYLMFNMDEMHFSNKLLQRKIFVNSSLFIVLKQIVIKKFSLIYKGLRTKFYKFSGFCWRR